MHGLAALYFGDHTAKNAGRLTLNPIPHIDPVGSILVPGALILSGSPILFGWAKPVPVNPLNFSNIRRGELVVSLAGVAANFGLAILAALLYHLTQGSNVMLNQILFYTVNINLLLAIFNFLPIPPLDGSKVVMSLLPVELEAKYRQLEQYGFFLLLLLWFIPFGNTSVLGAFVSFFLRIFRSLLGL